MDLPQSNSITKPQFSRTPSYSYLSLSISYLNYLISCLIKPVQALPWFSHHWACTAFLWLAASLVWRGMKIRFIWAAKRSSPFTVQLRLSVSLMDFTQRVVTYVGCLHITQQSPLMFSSSWSYPMSSWGVPLGQLAEPLQVHKITGPAQPCIKTWIPGRKQWVGRSKWPFTIKTKQFNPVLGEPPVSLVEPRQFFQT